MIDINDGRLDVDRNRNAMLLAKVIEAARKDFENSPFVQDKFKISAHDALFASTYPKAGNSSPFATARRHKRIVTGQAKGNPSSLRGPDIYRAIRLLLVNQARVEWTNVKGVLKSYGPPYSELIDLKPSASLSDLDKIPVTEPASNHDNLPGLLRDIAAQVEHQQNELKRTRVINRTLLKLVEERDQQILQMKLTLARKQVGGDTSPNA